MPFEGDRSVIGAMRTKQKLLKEGKDHSSIRILGIWCGGVKKGVAGGGAVTAMYEEGFGEVFDDHASLSTGTPIVKYLRFGKPRLGNTIYPEECGTKEFFNPFRFSNPCDVGWLVNSVFRNSPTKALDPEVVLAHRSRFWIAVTDYETAEQHFFRPRTADELFTLTQASIAMPGLCTEEVWFQGRRYVDGASVEPLPLRRLVSELHPTHVVVIANRARSLDSRTSLWEIALNETLFRSRISKAIRLAIRTRRERMSEEFRWALSGCPIPALISWGDASVSNFTRDANILRAAAERSRLEWVKALGDH